MCFVNLNYRGIRKLYSDLASCKWDPQIVGGIRIKLQITPIFSESAYICSIRNNYLYSLAAESATNQCIDKIYVTAICTCNQLKSFKWNPPVYWNMFKTCLWNPGTYRHKILLQSSAHFGLKMV